MKRYRKGGFKESTGLFIEHNPENICDFSDRKCGNMRDCKINVLGTEYRIEFKELGDSEIDGYCDYSSKHIVIRSDNYNKIEDFNWLQNKQLRHEIIHAFMAESGLQANWEHQAQFGHEETAVDWFAIQSPKIFAVFMEIGLIELDTSTLFGKNVASGVTEAVISAINESMCKTGATPLVT